MTLSNHFNFLVVEFLVLRSTTRDESGSELVHRDPSVEELNWSQNGKNVTIDIQEEPRR